MREVSGEQGSDAPAQLFLPRENPLPMQPCRLDRPATLQHQLVGSRRGLAFRRLFVLLGAAVLAIAGGYVMYDVLKVGGVTVMEGTLLILFLPLLAWVSFSFMSALAGFFVLWGGRQGGLPIHSDGPLPDIEARTAMLLPTYNEDPHQLMARLRAMLESVAETGRGHLFDWFVLSDSTDPDVWIKEEVAFIELLRACAGHNLYYRHRSDNTARKSGNIAEWVRRFGASYRYMIVLDADSLMEGDTIVRLVNAMEENETSALIQTQPVVVNASTLFSRLQQFAGRVYGPLVAAGNAWWHGSEGNYWGHNAIIRVRAFAQEAGLPELRGPKPFGGHIMSHDFVEAGLMRRAGWDIYTAPGLTGSFEEVPPSILDFVARDRRWCQGNLQHLAVLPARGLHWVSRLHLLTGIGSYITAPLWLIFLVLGVLISVQANFVRPEYFPDGYSLFPTWPAQDPVLAAWVFAGTMALLILPKFLAFAVLLRRQRERARFGGKWRVFVGIIVEAVLAALIAPLMMIFQSCAVAEILAGRDAGWQVQRRSGGEIARGEIYRRFVPVTLFGAAIGVIAYAVSIPLLLWMSPVILGLVLSIPIAVLTASPSRGRELFATPEDRSPPAVLVRANQLAAGPRTSLRGALHELSTNPELKACHFANLSEPARKNPGSVDVALATAQAKIEQCASFEEAASRLDKAEIRAAIAHRGTLDRIFRLRVEPAGHRECVR